MLRNSLKIFLRSSKVLMDLTILVAFYAIFPNSKTIFFNFEQNLIKFQTPCEQKRVQNVLDADFCLHFFYKPGAPIQSNSKHHTVLSKHDHRTLTKAIINFGFFSQLKVTPYLTRDLRNMLTFRSKFRNFSTP